MARRTLEQNLSTGILTPGNVAAIIGVSVVTVHNWIRGGLLFADNIPETREKRISAKEVVRFFQRNGKQVPQELSKSAEIFEQTYNDDFSLKSIFPQQEKSNP